MDFTALSDAQLVLERDPRAANEMQRRLKEVLRRSADETAAQNQAMIRLTKWLVALTWALVAFGLLTIGLTVLTVLGEA